VIEPGRIWEFTKAVTFVIFCVAFAFLAAIGALTLTAWFVLTA